MWLSSILNSLILLVIKMNNSTNQLFRDIDFLIDELGMSADQTDEVLHACDELGGISAEYFCEEFIFCPDESEPEDIERWHNDLYLTIPPQLRWFTL